MHVGQLFPQSTSVSSPFRTSSEHVGASQTPSLQTPLWQSAPPAQARLSAQAGHSPPPQSTSVSSAFRAPSAHVDAAQEPAVQVPLSQSASTRHASPRAQGAQAPPQSCAVSSPLRRPSWQLASGEGGSASQPRAKRTATRQALRKSTVCVLNSRRGDGLQATPTAGWPAQAARRVRRAEQAVLYARIHSTLSIILEVPVPAPVNPCSQGKDQRADEDEY